MRSLLLLTLVLLSGCSLARGDSAGTEAVDGSFALDLPDGWRARPDLEAPPNLLVGEGAGDEHLVASVLPGADGAEQRAIETVVGWIDSGRLPCRRLDDTIADGPVFDCPDRTRRPWMHKVYVPIRGGDRSVLLLVQVEADDFDDTVAVVAPVVASFEWR